jgi:hypothetical protein
MLAKLADKELANGGKPADGAKPWCVLIGDKFDERAAICVLPLMTTDLDDCLFGNNRTYGAPLLHGFAEVLKKVGKGEHTFELRIRPRATIVTGPTSEDFSPYFVGGGGDELRGRNDMFELYEKNASKFDAVFDKVGQTVFPADHPGFSVTFKMNADGASGGLSRKAAKMSKTFPDPCTAINTAWPLRNTGPGAAKAKSVLGGGAECVHLIVNDSANGQTGVHDMGKTAHHDDVNKCAFFWGLFKGKNKSPDADGCMVRFTMQKPVKRDGRACDGDWKMMGTLWDSDYISECLTLPNKEIDAAIERDADIVDECDLD